MCVKYKKNNGINMFIYLEIVFYLV